MTLDRRDLAALLLLAVLCILLRAPALERIALNPDESQYEATASYLVSTGTSGFAAQHGVPATFAVYAQAARWFGSYTVFPIRLLILSLCFATTALLFLALRKGCGRPIALLAAAVFLHHNLAFEGLSANREWFVVLPIYLGSWLAARGVSQRDSGSDRLSWIFVGGLLCGLAVWFKLQAIVLALSLPAWLLWQGLRERQPLATLRRSLVYGLGLAAAIGALALALAAAGGLRGYLHFLSRFFSEYAQASEAAASFGIGEYADRFFFDVPGGRLLTVAVVGAIVIVLRDLRGGSSPSPFSSHARLAVCLLATSAYAVRSGERFFDHYYLLLLPAAAWLYGCLLAAALRIDAESRLYRLGAIASLLLVSLSLPLAQRVRWVDPWLERISANWAVWLHLTAILLLLAWWVWNRGRRWRLALTLLLSLEGLGIVVAGQLMPTPPSLPHHTNRYEELARAVASRAGAKDRLFVWGWAPEIYSVTRLTAASRFTMTQYVVGDYRPEPAAPRIDEEYAAALMVDLEASSPRFLIDAAARSWTMATDDIPALYDLSLYPRFELNDLIARDYELIGSFDECLLFERRGPADRSTR